MGQLPLDRETHEQAPGHTVAKMLTGLDLSSGEGRATVGAMASPRPAAQFTAEDAGCMYGYDPEARCVTMRWSRYAPGEPFRRANQEILALIARTEATKLWATSQAWAASAPPTRLG